VRAARGAAPRRAARSAPLLSLCMVRRGSTEVDALQVLGRYASWWARAVLGRCECRGHSSPREVKG